MNPESRIVSSSNIKIGICIANNTPKKPKTRSRDAKTAKHPKFLSKKSLLNNFPNTSHKIISKDINTILKYCGC
jgi:hypothetical protein